MSVLGECTILMLAFVSIRFRCFFGFFWGCVVGLDVSI